MLTGASEKESQQKGAAAPSAAKKSTKAEPEESMSRELDRIKALEEKEQEILLQISIRYDMFAVETVHVAHSMERSAVKKRG